MSLPIQLIPMRSRRRRHRRPYGLALAFLAALAACAWFAVDGLPGRTAAGLIALFH